MKNIILGIIAILVIGGVAFWALNRSPQSSGPVSNSDDAAIRAMVAEFGSKLKNVSLLADARQVKTEMEQNYAAYLSPELLAQWEQNPNDALGRKTSSPWPDGINVISATQTGPTLYTVIGNVIEMANASSSMPEAVGVYPVTLSVEKAGAKWIITHVSEGSYSALPERKTITGTMECLPHKGSGPTTLECAFGIKEDGTGNHFALDTGLVATSSPLTYPTGTHLSVEGMVTPAEQLNSSQWQKYDISGIITATSITELK